MKERNIEIISSYTNEELNDLINTIKEEQNNRQRKEKDNLLNTLGKAWSAIEEAGFKVCVSNDYLNEDIPLNFFDIEIR